ncbi:hypothetical protein FSP39_002112 [Pinctada imbricata]|uniref:SOCS box domain-containing protein n=1 Tax=Pinctada imbricata TaxID=66713 RepID=A0AA88XPB5_PINIB|nr:hypothetical protein FSP39_002112 [Pinctada imbricata]
MEQDTVQSDANKISELLTVIWTKNDEEILNIISRNKDLLDIPVEFICMRSFGMLCEVCVKEGHLTGCKECRQMVCCCVEELETLPLSLDDKNQIRRLCINAYIGACPHIICLLKEENGIIDESFLQDKMVDYYTVVDMDYKAEIFQSSSNRLCRETDVSVNAGAYIEHLLLRLGKTQLLSQILNKYTQRNNRVRWTTHHQYTVLHLALCYKEIEFFMSEIKQKFMPRLMFVFNIFGDEGSEDENILYMAMSTDSLDAFCQLLKVRKKIKTYDYFGAQQRILNGALWRSIKDSKLEYTRTLLQSNMVNFLSKEDLKVDRYRDFAFSMVIQNNNNEVLDMLMSYRGFETYIMETLPLAVTHGNVQICEKLLCSNARCHKTKAAINIDIYTLAVLQNHPDIIEVLLRHKVPVIHMENVKFTALDFAIRFQRERCCEILRRAGHTMLENTLDTSPLIEIQRLADYRFFAKTLSFVNLVKELSGFNVNFEDQNGITPVQVAIKRRDYDTVRVLLQNGADLFLGQSFMLEYGTLRLVTEIIYCNVDIYNHLSSILEVVVNNTRFTRRTRKNWSLQKIDREKLIHSFISDSVHSLSVRDMAALALSYRTTLKSLDHLCKVTIRRHFGIHIHRYLSLVSVPETLKRFLLLSDEIDTFKSLIGWRKES